jgi:hypothetical protein
VNKRHLDNVRRNNRWERLRSQRGDNRLGGTCQVVVAGDLLGCLD